MAKIEQYAKKDGSTAWRFQTYLGVDPSTGKERRTTRRGFRTKKEATIALSRLQYEIAEKGFSKQKKYTYKEVYDLWLPQYKQMVKESTFWTTTRIFEHHILPTFGKLRIDKIDVAFCQKSTNDWFKNGLNNHKVILRYSSRVFKLAVIMDVIQDDPTAKVTYPVKRETTVTKKLPMFYDKTELQLFLECLEKEKNDKFITLFRTLAFTGARIGEILALEWRDIDFETSVLSIDKTVTRGINSRLMVDVPKTVSSIRDINLDPKTLSVLRSWKMQQAENYFKLGFNTSNNKQLVFSNTKNEHINSGRVYKEYIKIVEKYELKKINIHGFRHSFASLLFEAGASVKEVQDVLGHASYEITLNIYTHVTKLAKENTASKFANYIDF